MKTKKEVEEYLNKAYDKWDAREVAIAFNAVYYGNWEKEEEYQEIANYARAAFDMMGDEDQEIVDFLINYVGTRYLREPYGTFPNGTPRFIGEEGEWVLRI